MASTIYSYTIIRTPPEGFAGAPYCVAVIDNDGVRETARVSGYADGQEITIGDTVNRLDVPDEFGAAYSF